MKATLAILAVIVTTAAATYWATLQMTRPSPPNLNNPEEWKVLKCVAVGADAVNVRVLSFTRESTAWDPYDVRETKIRIRIGQTKTHEFAFPKSDSFDAHWCEVFRLADGSLAVVLFGNPNVVRVVRFSAGQFIFRPREDELLSPLPICYQDVEQDGEPEFVAYTDSAPSVPVVRHWDREKGFIDVSARYAGRV